MADDSATDAGAGAPFPLPRVTIKFCTQCKWNLRAAYFAQELLSTFSTSLGEVALQPSTGGTFIVEIFHTTTTTPPSSLPSISSSVLWDRATDGGFPETKELKRRVRDVIAPGRNLGHVDRDHARPAAAAGAGAGAGSTAEQDKQRESGMEAAGAAVAATAVLMDDVAPGGKKEACEDC